jgi:predicted Fe-S protein YdhL (DUF1289 family)
MQQLELLSIENPCINVCQSDKRGYCLGCFRSRDERFNWNKLTPPEKRKVLELCKQRGQRRKAKAKKQLQQQQIPIAAVESQTKQETPQQSESVKDMGLDMFDL